MKEKEDIRENKWDKLLKIHTMGRDDSNADQYHYPYEPTPYSVLERLAKEEYLSKRKMQNILLYQKKWTESISLIHFPWKYYKR